MQQCEQAKGERSPRPEKRTEQRCRAAASVGRAGAWAQASGRAAWLAMQLQGQSVCCSRSRRRRRRRRRRKKREGERERERTAKEKNKRRKEKIKKNTRDKKKKERSNRKQTCCTQRSAREGANYEVRIRARTGGNRGWSLVRRRAWCR